MSSIYFKKEENDSEQISNNVKLANKFYYIVKYVPAMKKYGPKKGSWKKLNRVYTKKEIDSLCDIYYQYGDAIKVKRNC